jgi:hypothetical protein
MSAINFPVNEPGSAVAVGLSLVDALARVVEGFVKVGELVPGPLALWSSWEMNATTRPMAVATNKSTATTAAMGTHGTFLPPAVFGPGGGHDGGGPLKCWAAGGGGGGGG